MSKFLTRLMTSKKLNLAILKPHRELEGGKSVQVSSKPDEIQESITSPYFSPRRTRNKVKIEYTDDVATSKTPKSLDCIPSVSQHFPKVKKQTLIKKSVKATEIHQEIPEKKIKQEFLDIDSTEVALAFLPDTEIGTKNALKTEKIKQKYQNDEELNAKAQLPPIKSEKWEPENWHQILENIRYMRQGRDAPVDTMGCHKCGDDAPDEKTKRFHILVALMLSSQTKDQTTYAAMERLKTHGLTPAHLVASQVDVLEKLIYPVSFYKNKSKYIQKAAQILLDQYDSDIPGSLDELIKLPGVGPKMAHICMHSAWNVVTGIGVDTHVHRISNRLGWVRKSTKTPEQTRMALEDWLPF